MFIGRLLWWWLNTLLLGPAALRIENLALRQQLAIYQRSRPRPRLRVVDRVFWVWLSRCFQNWQSWLIVVKPETVIHWHRLGFRLYWRWKSRRRTGRPPIDLDIRKLIRRMARENPSWGAPRIKSELRLLGHTVAESTVAKYMPKKTKPPSQTWRTFLKHHVDCTASMDFFVVPTATFKVLYVLVILCHERRRVVHFRVTSEPNAAWVAQNLKEAFPFDTAPRFLIHDRDGTYGRETKKTLAMLNTEEILTAPRSPWQNPFAERLIGSIRRECLDHVIVLNERHLHRVLSNYFEYYHDVRPHLSLDRNSPEPRTIDSIQNGRVIAEPMVGGLHHRYRRVA